MRLDSRITTGRVRVTWSTLTDRRGITHRTKLHPYWSDGAAQRPVDTLLTDRVNGNHRNDEDLHALVAVAVAINRIVLSVVW